MKTRFCPSPTGYLHIGNLRTALFNALYARKARGTFLLRIEDTDPERSQKEYVDALQADLKWLGLEWQEGPGPEGPSQPYYQSKRQSIYDRYYHKLEADNMAYPCFCSERQLRIVRKSQLAAGEPPRYPGTCRHLSADEVAAKVKAGETPVLRFKIPEHQEVSFDDGVKGTQRFSTNDIGDFIIRRANGTAPFMFCNAIDDALMGVSDVLRGDDHLTNTPRQILILQYLGLPIPKYSHISLITGPDNSPLSKRNGSKSGLELREEGYLPNAIRNYLARLGHYYENNALLDFNELAQLFVTDNLNPAPARFDWHQLQYWQKLAVQQLDDDSSWAWFGEDVRSLVPENLRETFITAVKPNCVFPKDAAHWASVIFKNNLVFGSTESDILQQAGADFFTEALRVVDMVGTDYKGFCQTLKETTQKKGKSLFMPLRVALTAAQHGPELAFIFLLLGSEQLKKRFTAAQQQLQNS